VIESHTIKIGLFTNPTQPVKRHSEKDNQNGMTDLLTVKTCSEKLTAFTNRSACSVKNHNKRPDANANLCGWTLKLVSSGDLAIPHSVVQGTVLTNTADNEKTAKSFNTQKKSNQSLC